MALSVIQSTINATFDTAFSLSAIDQAVRRRAICVAGHDRPLPPGWDAPIISLAQTIVADLVQAWGSGNNLDRIVLAGGGSAEEIIAELIMRKYPYAVVVDDPQHAIARGYARRARMLVAQMAMERAA
jgi:Tfp pilus assembly PilM family ATPase